VIDDARESGRIGRVIRTRRLVPGRVQGIADDPDRRGCALPEPLTCSCTLKYGLDVKREMSSRLSWLWSKSTTTVEMLWISKLAA